MKVDDKGGTACFNSGRLYDYQSDMMLCVGINVGVSIAGGYYFCHSSAPPERRRLDVREGKGGWGGGTKVRSLDIHIYNNVGVVIRTMIRKLNSGGEN